jgi:hypothetical protein
MKSKWKAYFRRVSGIKAPHNSEGNPLLAQELYDYEPNPLGWQFDENVSYPGETVSEISLKMCARSASFITYQYDAEKDVYLRFMGGKKFTSAETKQQVHVKNIIVQYSTYNSVQGIKLWSMVGNGSADYYIGGKLIKGSWERKSDDSVTIYYDDKGEQIVLRPGNTWIHIHPNP